jgi:hypothetical protein
MRTLDLPYGAAAVALGMPPLAPTVPPMPQSPP